MSTLVVAAISDGTTTIGISSTSKGSAKAWVNFNGTGTVAIRNSFNVTSITDNGTGAYTVNFTSAMSSTDYAFCISAGRGSGGGVTTSGQEISKTTSMIRVTTADLSSAGDYPQVNVVIFE